MIFLTFFCFFFCSGNYMYHCHNLVHEDNDMLLVFQVSTLSAQRFLTTVSVLLSSTRQ